MLLDVFDSVGKCEVLRDLLSLVTSFVYETREVVDDEFELLESLGPVNIELIIIHDSTGWLISNK